MTDLPNPTADPAESDALAVLPAMSEGGGELRGLHARVLDLLGLAICGGDLETGSVVRIEQQHDANVRIVRRRELQVKSERRPGFRNHQESGVRMNAEH